jgi:hypothetical protein
VDTLIGGAGADTLLGGAGNDILIWDSADNTTGAIQGGADTDVLVLAAAAQTLGLAGKAGTVITDIEIVNLTGTGNNTLNLSLSDVLALSSSTDTLRVDGNAGDVVSAGGGWALGTNQTISGQVYATYTQGLGTLLVDLDINRSQIFLVS